MKILTEKNNVLHTFLLEEELMGRIDKETGCPLCTAIMDFEFNQISQLQYEVTYMQETRKQVAVEGGFCDFHFRQFKKIANSKTNIILLKSIIEEGAFKKENFKAVCRICKNVYEYENKVLELFALMLNKPEIRNLYDNTNGICFIHLRQTNNLLDDEIIKYWLNEIHIKQIERMYVDFNNMSLVKSVYEIDHEKRRLINILIEKLAGRKTGAL